MSKQKNKKRCKHCAGELSGPYCSLCGRPHELKRISGQYVLSEIGSILNFQKGILFSVKELLLRPGISIRRFVQEDRNSLVKPIGFIILCSLIYIVAQQSLQFDDGYMNFSDNYKGGSAVGLVMEWISDNYGIANIIFANFIAIWVKVFFKKYGYNFFETLVLLYFIMGIQMLIFSFLGLAESVTKLSVLDPGSSLAIIYVCWAIGRFFDGKRKMNYLKGFFSYMFGMVSFIILAMIFGEILGLVIK